MCIYKTVSDISLQWRHITRRTVVSCGSLNTIIKNVQISPLIYKFEFRTNGDKNCQPIVIRIGLIQEKPNEHCIVLTVLNRSVSFME